MASQTNQIAEALRTLHRIHRQLNDLKSRLARGPRLLAAHNASVAKLLKAHEDAKAEYQKLRVSVDRKQLHLATNEAAVKKREGQLIQAADNREYQALKDQIAADTMANSVLADEILEGLEKSDELAAAVAAAEQALVKAREDSEKAKVAIAEEQPGIAAEIDRLQAEMKEVEQGLPGEFKEFYNRLVHSRGEDALSLVEGHFCSGCNRQLPVNRINELLMGKPVTCLACGRLLYLPEGYSF
ncbi:MAG: zinc ribbon domain-containing protein [Thermoguttaceae bacterium]